MLSPHVRVAGLKVFTDYDNANILLWEQADLNAFVLKEYRDGWQLAVKTVSTRSLEMVLSAYESARQAEAGIVTSRGRLEHALFATPEQIARIQQLGLIPSIQTNNPGQLVGEPDVDELIAREPAGSYAPWRSYLEAGIIVANGTGFPSYYVDEPSGAPFGSPVHLIYQGVTRVGNLGRQPYPWLLDQTITAEQTMRALTIDAAYAAFEEDRKGSLTAGKLADMVILSEDPRGLPSQQINNIQVLMTMIAGKVGWCAPGSETLCPTVQTTAVDPYTGQWAATDPADGSKMTLEITREGGTYSLRLVDEQAGICGLDQSGKPVVAAEIVSPGTISGDVLSTTVTSIRCLSVPASTIERTLAITYKYEADSDTLLDSSQGAVWHRQ
jgi:hypothetical protein